MARRLAHPLAVLGALTGWLGGSVALAGSTGTVQLLMPVANVSAPTNDFIISAAVGDGLNTTHKYWIEVPPGLARMRVRIFDPDIGIGGVAEATANPQRDLRLGGAFNSAAKYTLTRPDGTVAATQTCAAVVTAFCVDNAWSTLLDSVLAVDRAAGHWKLEVDERAAITAGDDVNAIGISADDGDATAAGTELNVYYDSLTEIGVNKPAGATTRAYTHYPYVTQGCSVGENDYDMESASAAGQSVVLSSRTGAFSSTVPNGSLSNIGVWKRNLVTGWATDLSAPEYGIWKAVTTIATNAAPANVSTVWFSNASAAANPPTANPQTNAFRVYFGTDGAVAPKKLYAEQFVRYASGPNPPVSGQATFVEYSLVVTNPGNSAVTFSTPTNVVNVPIVTPAAGIFSYAGVALITAGTTLVAQPAIGAVGTVQWNPATIAAGGSAKLQFQVKFTPNSAARRVFTNGSAGTFLDETGNAAQARATYTFGPLCDLAVQAGIALQVDLSRFDAEGTSHGVDVAWDTSRETGTMGFFLRRKTGSEWPRVSGLLRAPVEAPAGTTYEFSDLQAPRTGRVEYSLEEIDLFGNSRRYGPFTVTPAEKRSAPMARLQRETPAFEPLIQKRVSSGGRKPHIGGQGPPGRGPGPRVRVGVTSTALHVLPLNQLAPLLSVSPAQAALRLQNHQFRLTVQGAEIPWAPTPSGDGLVFYGRASDSQFSSDRAYVLELGAGALMPSDPSAGSTGVATAQVRLVLEQDVFPATSVSPDPTHDFWFWDYVASQDATKDHFDAHAALPPWFAPSPANVTVEVQGASFTGAEDHLLSVLVNGTEVGQIDFAGFGRAQATFAIPSGTLAAGDNVVTLQATGAQAGSYVFVDRFILDLEKPLTALADGQTFTTLSEGALDVTGDTWVVDVTQPEAPHQILVQQGQVWLEAAHSYVVSGTNALLGVSARPAAELTHPDGAQYLVITSDALLGPASALATYRGSQGLSVAVVTMERLYDVFHGSEATPDVVREYLRSLAQQGGPQPLYVVLAGAGSFDYRDRYGLGSNFVPVHLMRTSQGLYSADGWYGDLDDDGRADVAVGRIPARSAAELNDFVTKLIAFEAAPPDAWMSTAILAADVPSDGLDFLAMGQRVMAPLSSRANVHELALTDTNADDIRSQLLLLLQSGASTVNFVGHGGLDRFSATGLLLASDAPSLGTAGKVPWIAALTCSANRFELPQYRSLGESLVLAPGGAIAFVGPTGTVPESQQEQLGTALFAIAGTAGHRLGDATLAAIRAIDPGSDGQTFTLLGDPATWPAGVARPAPTLAVARERTGLTTIVDPLAAREKPQAFVHPADEEPPLELTMAPSKSSCSEVDGMFTAALFALVLLRRRRA